MSSVKPIVAVFLVSYNIFTSQNPDTKNNLVPVSQHWNHTASDLQITMKQVIPMSAKLAQVTAVRGDTYTATIKCNTHFLVNKRVVIVELYVIGMRLELR